MKKIVVLTLYSEKGASSQYRIFLFRKKINEKFEAKWSSFWNDDYVTKYMHSKKKYLMHIFLQYIFNMVRRIYILLFIVPKADVVFIQKAVIPKCRFLFLKRAKKRGVRIIFDIDDAVYVNSCDYSNEIASLADVVICGNELLKKHFIKYNDNVKIIPTVENTSMYKKYWRNTFSNKIVTWIGSETTIKNLELVVKPLNRVIERHPEVKFYIISNSALDYTKKIRNSVFIPWNRDTYISYIAESTIGIMPLFDNSFNRGKCGFKLIQYLNAKKPVIGSDVGGNYAIINGNGFIANSENEWEKYIEELLYDYDIYERCYDSIEHNFLKIYDYDLVCERIMKVISDN